MNNYFRILQYARPFRKFFPVFLVSTLLGVFFEIFNISLLAPILEVLFNTDPNAIVKKVDVFPDFSWGLDYFKALMAWGKSYILSLDDKTSALKVICFVLIVSVFFSNFFVFLSRFILAFVKAKMVRRLRVSIYEKINRLHLGYFTNEKRGDLISRMTNDVQEIENSIIATLNGAVKEPIKIVVTFIVLFQISHQLMLFSIVVLPLSGLVISQITRLLRKKAKQGQFFLGQIMGTIDETLNAMKIITSFNAQSSMNKKFDSENRSYERALRSMDYKRGLSSPLSQFLGVGVFSLVLYYGGSLVLKDKFLSAGEFIFFIFLFANVISPIKSITTIFTDIQRGLVAGDRIFEVLDCAVEIENSVNSKQLKSFDSEILIKDIQFSYNEEKKVLNNINLKIKKGQSVAFVGPSGGGKSTLADLIPRFYDVTSGSIAIDGIDIKDIDLEDLRNQVGIVTQESVLFNDSIINNIKFGKPSASHDEIVEAAKIANAHEFIIESEQGYDTVIGDHGTKLSGGQRQRLSIARAVLKNPPIMILDEATSALDTESEKLVQDALENLMKERTSIVIAHRLSTIQSADLIVVLKEGQIIEQGSHAELLSKDSFYKKLVDIQSA